MLFEREGKLVAPCVAEVAHFEFRVVRRRPVVPGVIAHRCEAVARELLVEHSTILCGEVGERFGCEREWNVGCRRNLLPAISDQNVPVGKVAAAPVYPGVLALHQRLQPGQAAEPAPGLVTSAALSYGQVDHEFSV